MCSRSMRLGVATTVSRVADGLADVKAAVLEPCILPALSGERGLAGSLAGSRATSIGNRFEAM